MTKAEPVVVKSLRELDILVHERVLGWHFDASVPGWWHESWTPELKKLELEVMAQTERYKDGPAADEVFPPHYSTEIADAWKVVEKLAVPEEPWYTCRIDYQGKGQAGAWFFLPLAGDHLFRGNRAMEHYYIGSTAQLAISIAALKTKDIEVTLAWE